MQRYMRHSLKGAQPGRRAKHVNMFTYFDGKMRRVREVGLSTGREEREEWPVVTELTSPENTSFCVFSPENTSLASSSPEVI